MKADVLVVGAGPAGTAAAIVLARSGADVLLVDRATFPRWKVCGACLGPVALDTLDRLGLGVEVRSAARRLSHLELRTAGADARIELDDSAVLARASLDTLLAAAARRAGARVEHGVRVSGLGRGASGGMSINARGGGEEMRIEARVVVDASGLGALRAADAGADRVAGDSRIGVGAVFGPDRRADAPSVGVIRMCVAPGGYVGSVVTEDGAMTVAAAMSPALFEGRTPPDAVGRLLDGAGLALPRGEPVDGWRGTPPLTRSSGHPPAGVFRVGDAGGYVEPFTGEGIGWALRSGVDVAPYVLRALAGGPEESAAWYRDRGVRMARQQRMCRFVSAGLRRTRLADAAVRVLHHAPALARPLVRMTARR